MRHHKRTVRNFKTHLQEMLESSKQTIAKGVIQNFNVTINYLQLNKPCTVAHIWWDINIIPPNAVSHEMRMIQLQKEQQFVQEEMQRQRNEAQKRKEEEGIDMPVQTADQILEARDLEILNQRRAEVQKRLTKAASWLSGQLTRRIGLRYAPELRFYLDTTLKQMEEYDKMANEYLKEAAEAQRKEEEEQKKAAHEADFHANHKESFLKDMQSLAEGISEF